MDGCVLFDWGSYESTCESWYGSLLGGSLALWALLSRLYGDCGEDSHGGKGPLSNTGRWAAQARVRSRVFTGKSIFWGGGETFYEKARLAQASSEGWPNLGEVRVSDNCSSPSRVVIGFAKVAKRARRRDSSAGRARRRGTVLLDRWYLCSNFLTGGSCCCASRGFLLQPLRIQGGKELAFLYNCCVQVVSKPKYSAFEVL